MSRHDVIAFIVIFSEILSLLVTAVVIPFTAKDRAFKCTVTRALSTRSLGK